MRVDKWLWAVRFYKTRSLATTACLADRVRRRQTALKAGTKIQVGDVLSVSKDGLIREIEVVELLEKRVSASLAQQAFVDHTPLQRVLDWQEEKKEQRAQATRTRDGGRPSKKERRAMVKLKKQLGWD